MGNNSLHVYLAASYEAKDRIKAMAEILNAIPGVKVTASWFDKVVDPSALARGGEDDASASMESALSEAVRDLDEIYEADLLILDTIATNDRGGKDTEFGAAYSSGGTTWVVGPYRNVFQRLADKHFESWAPAVEYLKAGGIDEWWYHDGTDETGHAYLG